VRSRAADGRWALVEAARLHGSSGGIAVTIGAAGIEDVLELVSRASGLTARECELVALLLEGPRHARARRPALHLAPHVRIT
jgi:hypothetical protein